MSSAPTLITIVQHAEKEKTPGDPALTAAVGDASATAGERFGAVVDELRKQAGRNVVLVTHGGVTVDGLWTLLGDEALSEQFPQWRNGVPPAALTTLQVTPDAVTALAIADTSHLSS